MRSYISGSFFDARQRLGLSARPHRQNGALLTRTTTEFGVTETAVTEAAFAGIGNGQVPGFT